MKGIRTIISASLLLAFMSAGAAETATSFYRLPLNGTLAQNTVSTMLQDRDGQMWFGTLGGLNVYDGFQFHLISSDPRDPDALSGVHIARLFQDRRGMIWVAGYQGWLDRIDPQTGRITHYPGSLHGRGGIAITGSSAFFESDDGVLWLGTPRGLFRYAAGQDEFAAEPLPGAGDARLAVRDIVAAGNGQLWLATNAGLYRYDPASGQADIFRHDPQDPNSLSSDFVSALAIDSAGNLWAGTAAGLNRWNEGGSFKRYRHEAGNSRSIGSDVVISLYRDPEGPLWIATQSGGLNRYVPESDDFDVFLNDPDDPNSLVINDIWSVFRDASGLLWIGTAGSGLNQINPSRQRFETLRAIPFNSNSLRSPFVWDIQEDANGAIWMATLAGLERYQPDTRRFTLFQPRPGTVTQNQLQSLYIDATGRIWAGGVDGHLYHFDPGSGAFRSLPNPQTAREIFSAGRIWFIGGDGRGRVWISHGADLLALDEKTLQVSATMQAGRSVSPGFAAEDATASSAAAPSVSRGGMNERDADPVRTLFTDSDGYVWFGGGGLGLSRYTPDTGEWINLRHDPAVVDSLSHNVVRSLYEDEQGGLWVGTLNGLNYLAPEDRVAGRNRFRLYTVRDGLPNNTIYGILPDDEAYLWLSTNNGLGRFNPATGETEHFDAADGLPSNELNGGAELRARDGTLYFGGVGGAVRFHPRRLTRNEHMPAVRITGAEVHGKPLTPPGIIPREANLQLEWHQNDVSFRFAVMDFHQPEKNRYRYRLAGYSGEWTETDRNTVSFARLPPGNYRLEVQGSNNDGMWSESAGGLDFALKPPLWRTQWAYLSYSLALLGMLVFYHLTQRRKLAREREFSEQLSRAHTLAEANHKMALRYAQFDHLTQLPNRMSLLDAMARYMRFARTRNRCLAVLLVNLDHFQQINDSLGHSLGDRILKTSGERLAAAAQADDYVARVGSDEFALLTVVPEHADASAWLADYSAGLHAALAAPLGFGDQPLSLSASLGCAVYRRGAEQASDLLGYADIAMHVAKREARGKTCFYEPAMTENMRERLNIQARMQRALEDGEFKVYFQPVVNLRTGALAACEALIRWKPPAGPAVYPDQFIPVAEDSGQIVAIGRWVINECCRQIRLWQRRLPPGFKIAVNVSMKQLRSGTLVDSLREALQRHRVSPGYLKLEITESAMMENVEDTAEQLRAVKALGVTVSIDDFGTGFSSLSHLKMLPVNEIKVDRSFVADIANSEHSRKIVDSIIRLGHELKLDIVAEGIEDEEALEYLLRSGCDMGQGFHFAKPMPAGELEADGWLDVSVLSLEGLA